MVKYVICVNYNNWSEERGPYVAPAYLGTLGKRRVFIFSDEIDENTKRFSTAQEAGKYVDTYFSDPTNQISYKNLWIAQIVE